MFLSVFYLFMFIKAFLTTYKQKMNRKNFALYLVNVQGDVYGTLPKLFGGNFNYVNCLEEAPRVQEFSKFLGCTQLAQR